MWNNLKSLTETSVDILQDKSVLIRFSRVNSSKMKVLFFVTCLFLIYLSILSEQAVRLSELYKA